MAENKTAYLISCSDHYNHRLHITDTCLKQMGFKTVYITSDFDHNTKTKFVCSVEGCVQLHAKEYKKNLSFSRILSHRGFAKTVFKYIEQLPKQPDVIVALLPPNFLAYYGAKYKKRHPDVKLFFDIFDLWPETFPSSRAKKLLAPIFNIWALIRDNNLDAADFIFTECEMFKNKLGLSDEKSKSIYLCNDKLVDIGDLEIPENQINLCYLGSINNIIDIDRICNLIKDLSAKTKVKLHIIGKGEKEEEFITSAKQAGAEVVFYGAVYDDKQKQDIINKCHYGLNIMKPSVSIGLTMKSIDYFRHGIPIINNIPADTQDLVQTGRVGIQLDENTIEKILNISNRENEEMRKHVLKMFFSHFETSVVLKKYEEIFSNLKL